MSRLDKIIFGKAPTAVLVVCLIALGAILVSFLVNHVFFGGSHG